MDPSATTSARTPGGLSPGQLLAAGGWVLLPWTAAALASRVRSRSVKNWKRSLQRPPKPPLWWLLRRAQPLVYGSAGVASLCALRGLTDATGHAPTTGLCRAALVLYGCGVLLDVAWSPLLHGAKLVGVAAAARSVASVALAGAVPLMALGVSPVAGVLLLPLLAWECSGAYWNYALWRLNRHHIHSRRSTHGYSTLGEE